MADALDKHLTAAFRRQAEKAILRTSVTTTSYAAAITQTAAAWKAEAIAQGHSAHVATLVGEAVTRVGTAHAATFCRTMPALRL